MRTSRSTAHDAQVVGQLDYMGRAKSGSGKSANPGRKPANPGLVTTQVE